MNTLTKMKTYKIAAMGGDGIGPEIVAAAVQALKVCAQGFGVVSNYSRFKRSQISE